ncbi:isochorismate synthase [Streptomyces sp. NPDC005790]|uniref:isochorismate synthase n=1 Tax=Streptomyces sp. NPDC005790 TaxID=3154777 RepID=UPI00340943A0
MTADLTTAPPADRRRTTASVPVDRDGLLATCREAVAKARATRAPVLASWAEQHLLPDPLTLWSRARRATSRSFMWQSAWDRGTVMAIGTARDLRGRGENRIDAVRADWAALTRDLVTGGATVTTLGSGQGPLAVGGFAFRAENPSDRVRLPDALLWVPALQIRSACADPADPADSIGAAELRLNAVLLHDSDPEQITEGLLQLAGRCLAARPALERPAAPPAGERTLRKEELPTADSWKGLVGRATERIRAGEFEKVVLARELRVTASEPYDVPAVVGRLRTANPTTTLFAVDHDEHAFLGATPEYLVRVEGRSVETLGLAGTAPRGSTPEHDEELAQELVESAKIQHEHDVVVQMLRDALGTSCQDVSAESPPRVVKLANVQHLSTNVRGRLPEGSGAGILDLVAQLHPTPALGGHPRKAALSWLDDNEGLDRGWYAGVVGWADAGGQGQFAVTIRSALLDGGTASLYAGCGIVADSDPEAEYAETCAKLRPMLSALRIEGP